MATFAEQFEAKRKSGSGSSFATRFENEGSGRKIVEDFRIKQQETQKQQQFQALQQQPEPDSWTDRAMRFIGGAAKEIVKGAIVRPTISLAEVPLNVATGGKRTFGDVNVPLLGKVESYQSEAGRISGEIVEGQKPLRSVLKPMGEAILDIGGLGVGGQIVKQGVKQGFKQIAKKAAIEGAGFRAGYGATESLGEGAGVKETAKSIGTSAVLGGVLGVGIAGVGGILGKAFSKLGKKSPKLEKALKENKVSEKEIEEIFNKQGIEGVEKKIDEVIPEKKGILQVAREEKLAKEIEPVVSVKDQQPDLSKELNKKDYETILKTKIDELPVPKKGEVTVIQSGSGKYVDTQIDEALGRGINKDTKVFNVPKETLRLTDNTEKNLRGERLYSQPQGITPKVEAQKVVDIQGAKAKLEAFQKDKETFVNSFLDSGEGQKVYAEMEKQILNNEEFANNANKNVISGIKNSPFYRKEKSISDSMGEGFLMIKNGRNVVVSSDDAKRLAEKGWKKQIEIDTLANEAGFEKGEGYLNYQLELLEKNGSLSTNEKLAHEQLLKTDEGYKMLDEEITNLKKQIKDYGEFKKEVGETIDTAKKEIAELPKTKESGFAERLNKELPEEYKINEEYEVARMKDEAIKASDLIRKDKQKALRIATGIEKSDDLTQTATSIELGEIAKRDKDWSTVNELFEMRRQAGTRRGQEISMEKMSVLLNPEEKFMKDVVNARLGKTKFTGEELKNVTKRIIEKTKQIKETIKRATKTTIKIAKAQKLLDDLICK